QHFPRLRLERVSAEMLVLFLDAAEPIQDCVHLAEPGGIFHRLLQGLELVVQVAEPSAAGNGLVQYGSARHLFDVLPEISDRGPAWNSHLAVVSDFLPPD